MRVRAPESARWTCRRWLHPTHDVRREGLPAAMGGLSERGDDGVSMCVGLAAVAATDLPRDDGSAQLTLCEIVRRGHRLVIEEAQKRTLMAVKVFGELEVLGMRDVLGGQCRERFPHFSDGLLVDLGRDLVAAAPELKSVLQQRLHLAREANGAAGLLGVPAAHLARTRRRRG